MNNGFDRSFDYDFAGRLSSNAFGTVGGVLTYSQSVSYDPFLRSHHDQRSIGTRAEDFRPHMPTGVRPPQAPRPRMTMQETRQRQVHAVTAVIR
ncbi:MAG: hypothetical protein IPK98_11310 [Chloracidobacterium sp.]|nr:hypothetical protein [Chloracidobacterium sp.]